MMTLENTSTTTAVDEGTPSGADGADQLPSQPEPTPRGPLAQLLTGASRMFVALVAVMIAWAAVVAPLAHVVTQRRLSADLRSGLNMATVPVVTPAPDGTPLAFLDIPSIGLRRVIVAGTSARSLASGPGLLRTSRLPGQAGTSVVMGRRALFGGDFADLADLRSGDRIAVTTGQGPSEYRVESVRRWPSTAPEGFVADGNHLLLMTSDSTVSASTRLVVDAVLVGEPRPTGARPTSRPGAAELGLDGDRSGLPSLVAWGEIWLAVLGATAWLAIRWRARATWVLTAPVHLALATVVAEQLALLLPPLL